MFAFVSDKIDKVSQHENAKFYSEEK